MNTADYQKIDAIIPGVTDTYTGLKLPGGSGIQTSTGTFYNSTIFGRDSSMAGKFLVDIDHGVARAIILTLSRLQGVKTRNISGEEIGKIHHEWRDYRLWHGTALERVLMFPWRFLWGGNDKLLLTYFSVDSTASYIRLVHKYARHIDPSILSMSVVDQSGVTITVGQAVERAAQWITAQVGPDNLIRTKRSNPFSLPFQTYQDSATAYVRLNGSLAKYRGLIGYVESQAFAADALYDACDLLPTSEYMHQWHATRDRLDSGLFDTYWRQTEEYMAAAIDKKGQIDRHMVTPGWTLNTSLWDELPIEERTAKISALVRQLFSSEFLTPVGLRSRGLSETTILKGVVEYHGSLTVWPMFTFMVIEGLRRHRLYTLADQLEARVINGLNCTGTFDEYFIVTPDQTLLIDNGSKTGRHVHCQMPVEKNIAFSVIPAIVMGHRQAYTPPRLEQSDWQKQLESEIMATIDTVSVYEPQAAIASVGKVEYIRLRRLLGGLKSTGYFIKESLKP